MAKALWDMKPARVRSGPCQEVVLQGEEVDLDLLPVQRCWPGDPAPFITLPAVITRDPRTGTRNVGMYRMQKLGPRATAMHWQIHKDGRADYLATDGRIEVAVREGSAARRFRAGCGVARARRWSGRPLSHRARLRAR